jgi:hypothetical protein
MHSASPLPTHRPLIEIDYNDVDAYGLTRFRFSNVISEEKLAVGQAVTAYQPEDGTYTEATVEYLNPITFAGKLRVLWKEMKEYRTLDDSVRV